MFKFDFHHLPRIVVIYFLDDFFKRENFTCFKRLTCPIMVAEIEGTNR